MSFGFHVKNKAGKDIVRGIEETYLLYKKGSITKTFPLYPDMGGSFILDTLDGLTIYDNPMLFMSIRSYKIGFVVAMGVMPKGINLDTGQIYDSRAVINLFGWSLCGVHSLTIDYYVFAPAKSVPKPGHGLELYNDKGTLAFHNGAKPLNITGFVTAPQTEMFASATPIKYSRNDSLYAYRTHRGYSLTMDCYGVLRNTAVNHERFPYITKAHY